MVLATNHIQTSYATVPLNTLSWNKGIRLKQNVIRCLISRTDRCISLKEAFPLRPAARHICGAKGRPLRISSFKGNKNDEPKDTSKKSVLPKSPVKISVVHHNREEPLVESLTEEDMPNCSVSESNKSNLKSEAIRKLFAKWLSLLRAESPAQDDILEGPPQKDHVHEQKAVAASTKERGEILKVVLCYFLGLDATITIPLMIFVPFYLGVNMVYGAEVSRELTPLWIIGPLIAALYVKLFRGIIALYVFSFKQAAKVIRNLPTIWAIAYNFLFKGKLQEDIDARFWQPIKNLDYKELTRRKWKELREWLVERCIDFVEMIWPYYCRTIRFLKRANFI